MLVYLLILLLFVFFVVVNPSEKDRLLLSKFFIIILILLATFRVGIGTDYLQYYWRWINSKGIIGFFSEFTVIELGSNFILSIVKSLHLPINAYFFVMTTISLMVLYKAIRRLLPNYTLEVLFLYYCFFYLSFQFNIVRHGVMASFVWLAFSYLKEERLKGYFVSILLGFLFHASALFFIIFPFVLKKRWSDLHLVIFMLASLVLSYINVFKIALFFLPKWTIFYDKIYFYLYEYASINYGLTLGLLTYLGLFFIIILVRRIIEKKHLFFNSLLNIFVLSLSLAFIFNSVALFVERIVGILFIAIILLIPMLVTAIAKNKGTKSILTMVMLLYGILLFYRVISYKNTDGENQFVPYRTVLVESNKDL